MKLFSIERLYKITRLVIKGEAQFRLTLGIFNLLGIVSFMFFTHVSIRVLVLKFDLYALFMY